jgi:serine protease Do
MDEILLLETIERYNNGTLSNTEKQLFEALRNENRAVDQFVVEQNFLEQRLNEQASRKNLKHLMQATENELLAAGEIKTTLVGKAKIIQLFNKYKRVSVIAAGIAGIVSLITVGAGSFFNNTTNGYTQLSEEIKNIKNNQARTNQEIKEVKSKVDPRATPKSGGTGFLIDGDGYLVTNAHVIKGSKIIAINSKGNQFIATLIVKDNVRDIAIIKIEDADFKPLTKLPYSFNRRVNLAAPVYTLGFPKEEIVYSEGYLSSLSGYQSDTLSYQISIDADHGNSGGPILNKAGEVIGILTGKANGSAVFAIKSEYIFNTVAQLSKDSAHASLAVATNNSIKNLSREQQVLKVNNCVFSVKSYE